MKTTLASLMTALLLLGGCTSAAEGVNEGGLGGAGGELPNSNATSVTGGCPDCADQPPEPWGQPGGFNLQMPQEVPVCGGVEVPRNAAYLAPSVHSNMLGAQLTRASLLQAQPKFPPANALNVDDFQAYYGQVPTADELTVALSVLADPELAEERRGWLGISLAAPDKRGTPLKLVVLLDESTSAASVFGEQLAVLAALKEGMSRTVVNGDELTVLSFAESVDILATNIDTAADVTLNARPGSDLELGVLTALQTASSHGHVVLVTDGGALPTENLVKSVYDAANLGTRLSVVQIGKRANGDWAPPNQQLISALAVAGGGSQHFITDAASATRSFDERFSRLFATYDSSVGVSVALPGELQAVLPPDVGGSIPRGPLLAGAHTPLWVPLEADCSALWKIGGSLVLQATVSAADLSESTAEVTLGEVLLTPADVSTLSPAIALQHGILLTVDALRGRSLIELQAAQSRLADLSGRADYNAQAVAAFDELAQLLDAAELAPGLKP